MTSLTRVTNPYYMSLLLCILVLDAVLLSLAQGDPSRVPTGNELDGLEYQYKFPVWPVCANSCPNLQTAYNASAEEWCTASLFGGCMEVGEFIRRPKFCAALETLQCPSSTCVIGNETSVLVSWVNSVCNLTLDAEIRWNRSISEQAQTASRLTPIKYFDRGPICSNKCSGLSDLYTSSLFNEQCSGTKLQQNCPNNVLTSHQCMMNRTELQSNCVNSTSFVNTTEFCAGLTDTTRCPLNACLIPPGPTKLLSWIDSVCNFTTEAHTRWNSSVSQRQQILTHLTSVDSFRAPDCTRNCQSLSNSYSSSLFYEQCIDKDHKGRCLDSGKYVNKTQYCAGLANTDHCPNACTYGHEPRNLFSWLNSTCTNERLIMESWRNVTLAKEQQWLADWITDLLPWKWTVQSHKQPIDPSSLGIQITDPMTSSTPYVSVPPSGAGTCLASAREKLGVFAAVNVISACMLPILGRRDFVNKMTFGIGGRLGSKGWRILGILSACMHILSNVVNAYLIRRTPGYEDVPFTALALFWCTRPRLSWLAVFLATFQADKGMYLNSAASAITTEAILQSVGAVYFGISANYARKKGFFLIKHLDPYPRGRDAHIMYAGALLWLIILVFTLIACGVSITGINSVISNARSMMKEIERRADAGANAVRAPVQKWMPKWTPKWLQNRVAEQQRQSEEGPKAKEPRRDLSPSEIQEIESVAAAVIIFLAFMAQWLFWAGFVKASGERYCPPKLATLGVIWGAFSAAGVFVGSAH